MKLIKDFINKIDQDKRSPLSWTNFGGFCWIGDNIKGKLFKDINILSFTKLYPMLIVLMCEDNIIEDKSVLILKELLNKNKDDRTLDESIFINSYYYSLDVDNRYRVSTYTKLMMEYILFLNKNIIYIDTDMIFYTGDELNMGDVDLPNTQCKFDYLIMDGRKKYVIYEPYTSSNGEEKFRVFGYPMGRLTNPDINIHLQQLESNKSRILQEKRNDILESLGV